MRPLLSAADWHQWNDAVKLPTNSCNDKCTITMKKGIKLNAPDVQDLGNLGGIGFSGCELNNWPGNKQHDKKSYIPRGIDRRTFGDKNDHKGDKNDKGGNEMSPAPHSSQGESVGLLPINHRQLY